VPAIVVVQKGDVLARNDANTGVACGVPTSVLLVSKHAKGDRRPERDLLQSLLDRRRRAVVDDEQFDVRVGLCADARHCFANQRRTVVRRENDADERCVGGRSITHPEVSLASFVETAASGRRNRERRPASGELFSATTAGDDRASIGASVRAVSVAHVLSIPTVNKRSVSKYLVIPPILGRIRGFPIRSGFRDESMSVASYIESSSHSVRR
jgi:hypothetical protein